MAARLLPLELIDKCIGSRLWIIMKGDKVSQLSCGLNIASTNLSASNGCPSTGGCSGALCVVDPTVG